MIQYMCFFTLQPVTLSAKSFSRKFCSLNTMVNSKTFLESNERKAKGTLLCLQKENILVLQAKICKKNKLYFKKNENFKALSSKKCNCFSTSFLGRITLVRSGNEVLVNNVLREKDLKKKFISEFEISI